MRRPNRAVLSTSLLLVIGPGAPSAASQPAFESVDYVLGEDSTYQEGCFAPCTCPIIEPQPMRGTFVLQQLPSQGPLDLFEVGEVNWQVPSLGRQIDGAGWYRRGGDLQILDLDLRIDGGALQSFSSGPADNGDLFPLIDITVTINDFYCYDIVLHIAAAPEQAPFPTPSLVVDEAVLAWSPVAGAAGYDVLGGDLGYLRGSGGDFAGAVDLCLADDYPGTWLGYEWDVGPGWGVWFLVRDGGPYGTYDSGGTSQSGSRDAGADASPLACP